MSTKAFQALAADIERATDAFEPGSVIRWKARRRYTYVAVKAAKRWYISGTTGYYAHDGVTYEQLAQYLARDEVSDIQYAVEWSEAVKRAVEQDFTAIEDETRGVFVVALADGGRGNYEDTEEAAWERAGRHTGYDPSVHG